MRAITNPDTAWLPKLRMTSLRRTPEHDRKEQQWQA
jgi:hypothetical protein